jgi:hypothetical protein
LEEALAFVRVVAELVAQGAEGTGRIAEPGRDLGRRESLKEVSAEGFVLAVQGGFGGEEELSSLVCR